MCGIILTLSSVAGSGETNILVVVLDKHGTLLE